MSSPKAKAAGAECYLRRLAARRDEYRASWESAKRQQEPWLRRLLHFLSLRKAPPDRLPNCELVTDIAELLEKYDPVGLVGPDRNDHAYVYAARQIAAWLPWVRDEAELHGLVFEIFYKAFDFDFFDEPERLPWTQPQTYIPIASDLLAVRQRYCHRFYCPSQPSGE